MGQVICVTSQKGGVGKTTTAVNLSTALAMAEKKSLLVDCDPQGNATTGVGIDKSKLYGTLYHAMIGKVSAEESIINTKLHFLKTLPARIELFRAETELRVKRGKEKILRNLLNNIRGKYDYIIIDSPPSLGLLTVNAITAADSLLIPLQCEFYALEGISPLLKTIKILKRRFNPGVKIGGILLTMFESEEEICRQIAEEARNHFKGLVLKTVIPRDVGLRESATHGGSLLLKDILAIGAQRYLDLASELMAGDTGISGERASL